MNKKKFVSIFIIAVFAAVGMIFTSGAVSAEIYSDKVSVIIDTVWRANQSINDAYFDLYSSSGEHLGRQVCEVTTNNRSVITFPVPTYPSGTQFVLKMNSGYSLLQHYNDLIADGGSFTLGTYAYADPGSGQVIINDTFYLTGVPYSTGNINLYVNDHIIQADLKNMRGIPIAPLDILLDSIGIPWYEQTYDYTTRNISITHNGTSLVMNMDNPLAFINDSVITGVSVKYIDDKFYAPVGFVLSAFGVNTSVEESGGNITVYASAPKTIIEEIIAESSSNNSAAENFVNGSGVSSRTDYLIWISKKDYKVYVFLGSKGNWTLCNEFTCAIGKSSTPTITGQFEYFSKEARWSYDKYYVGPIMRFKGGYAIHSTLLSYNGSDYDARVGMKLSKGCVRVRKPDIDWLVAYVPLYTRIYITE
ncbi:MAG: L,D-transpeptidase family protein [Oscillospiraceae bacterium]|nr:L,D-transpeptidase family protein [Oscillospiraceae bacterium]